MMNRRNSQNTSFFKALPVVAVLGVGCTLTFGLLLARGWLQSDEQAVAKASRVGMIAVPRSLGDLEAFEKVRREDIYDRAMGDDSYFWLSQASVESHPEWITSVDQIIGRVLSSDKKADFVFQEKDFLPEGSRTGIAGGVPAGKQGFFLTSADIPGLRFLRKGDRFDLLASDLPDTDSVEIEYGQLMGGIKVRGGKPIPLNGVRVLVQNAEVIALATDSAITTHGVLKLNEESTRGRSSSNVKEERVAIAIDPLEAIPLTQALGEGVEIQMVTLSGQDSETTQEKDLLKGKIGFASNSIVIPAFQPIRASDLSEVNTGELRQFFFAAEDIKKQWIPDADQLVGRVVNREIEPGYIFQDSDFLESGSLLADVHAYEPITAENLVDGEQSEWVDRVALRDLNAGSVPTENDLFPVGTPPGLAAAIPDGRMALTIEIESVRGASELKRGDRLDLLGVGESDYQAALQGVEVSPALAAQLNVGPTNRVLASKALVLEIFETEMVLALAPSEISLVAKTISAKEDVFCVTRSAASLSSNHDDVEQAGDEVTELQSDPDPLRKISITETIIGGERVLRAYGVAK